MRYNGEWQTNIPTPNVILCASVTTGNVATTIKRKMKRMNVVVIILIQSQNTLHFFFVVLKKIHFAWPHFVFLLRCAS